MLHTFVGGNDGAQPYAGLIRDKAGNLYGTTANGGSNGGGTVFKIARNGEETVLYSLGAKGDGSNPYGALLMDSTGNLYGTTLYGGIEVGTVFKLAPDGSETVLHAFAGGSDGAYPSAGLIQDAAGNLYGTTSASGGNNCGFGCGTVFSVTPTGAEKPIYTFQGGNDGGESVAGLIMDKRNNLYGTTEAGGGGTGCGGYGCGTVFKLKK